MTVPTPKPPFHLDRGHIVDAAGRSVARIPTDVLGEGPVYEQTTALFVAAPEMVELLAEALLSNPRPDDMNPDYDDWAAHTREVLQRVGFYTAVASDSEAR